MRSKDNVMFGRVVLVWLLAGAIMFSGACAADVHGDHSQAASLESILKKVAHYRRGVNDDVILELRAYIRSHRQSPDWKAQCEGRLVDLLLGEATADGKMEACRQLRSLGTARSVPALEALLERPESADMARYALEKIPGAESEQALLRALDATSGNMRLGIISSLGHRRSTPAVAALGRLAGGRDPAAARASVTALGRIATKDAAEALMRLRTVVDVSIGSAVDAGLLNCAETLAADGLSAEAARVYQAMFDSQAEIPLRRAALMGLIATSGESGRDRIIEVLDHREAVFHPAAIAMVPEVFSPDDLRPLCDRIPRLPAPSQVQLISVLASYSSDLLPDMLIQALTEPTLEVRLAALKALQRQGDASLAMLLVRQAVNSRGIEQTASRNALWNLADPQVDEILLTALSRDQDAAILQEVIQAVAGRRIEEGKTLVFERMMDPDPQTRIQAFRALRTLAGPEDVPRLLERLLAAEDVGEQEELATTTAVAARKIGRPEARADLVVNKLRSAESPDQKRVLILVLGKIGDDSSLTDLRRALADDDPAVREAAGRALTEWPTPTARDDLFWLAENSDHPTLQVLAVRAYVRLVGLDLHRRPEAAVDSLRAVLPWIRRPEEKMAVLGVLPLFPSREALTLAESFLSDASVQEEAQVAVERLLRSLQ